MSLVTKAILQKFQKTWKQYVENPVVIAKFFNPVGIGTWYATEYDPDTKVFFGRVDLHESEWGYFSKEELENVSLPFPWSHKSYFGELGIERDIYFEPTQDSEL